MINGFNFEFYFAVLAASTLGCSISALLMLIAGCTIGTGMIVFDVIWIVVWPVVAGLVVRKS